MELGLKKVFGKVKRTYKKTCSNKELCKPECWFDTIEECKICKRKK